MQGIFCAVCSPYSTLQQGSSYAYRALRTSARRLKTFIGFAQLNASCFKLATQTFRCLHGLAPRYLSTYFVRVAVVPSCRRLQPMVSSFGTRAFPVAGANSWNGLHDELASPQFHLFSSVNLKRVCFVHHILTSTDRRFNRNLSIYDLH